MSTKNSYICCQECVFSTKCFSLKDLSTYLHFPTTLPKLNMCQIMIISLLWNKSESWVAAEHLLSRGNCRLSKKGITFLSLFMGPRLLFPGCSDITQDTMPFLLLPYQTIFFFPIMISMTVTCIIIDKGHHHRDSQEFYFIHSLQWWCTWREYKTGESLTWDMFVQMYLFDSESIVFK